MHPNLFKDLSPPVHGGVYTFAHTATAWRAECPPDWIDAVVKVTNQGTTDLYLAFGDGGVMVAAAAVATVTTETLTANWSSGDPIPPGVTVEFPIGPNCTHFAVDSAATGGNWTIRRSSGSPTFEEPLDIATIGKPILWLDASVRSSVDSTTVGTWRGRFNGSVTEASAKPSLLDASAVGAGLVRPAVSFTAGSSHKLVGSDATIAAALGGTNSFTLMIAARRGAASANHTLFSVGTGGSNNGRWDFTLNSSDDPIITRVTSGGASTTSAVATTIASGEMHLYVVTFDGTTPLYYQDRVATALTGTAAGDVGTTTKFAVGCRAYNTSTFDQFATAQIAEVIAWDTCLVGEKLDKLHAWAKRRYAK